MAKRKGILGKVLDQVTPDEDDGKKGPGGLLGKVLDQVSPDDDKKESTATAAKPRATRKKQGGLIGAIKDRMDGDDESKSGDVTTAAKPRATTRKKRGGVIGAIQDRLDGDDGKQASSSAGAPTMSEPASGPVTTSDYGTVIGTGMNRVYVSRPGDSMAAIAAFFYGDATHRQRLLDDNPELEKYMGALPGGIRIRVSEDAGRGDTVKNSGY